MTCASRGTEAALWTTETGGRPSAAHPTVHNVLRQITAGQRALVSSYVTLCLLPAGAAPPMVSHLILESRLEIKIEISRLTGAPLRNRTVDLLLTISTAPFTVRTSSTDDTAHSTDSTR